MLLRIKLFFLFVPLALLACGRLDISSSRYETYAAALDAGAIGPGRWLPSQLPASAVGIRETHDIDTNEVWFSYASASNRPPEECSELLADQLRLPRTRWVYEVEEFFRGLKDVQASGRASFHSCHGAGYDYYLVIDPERNLAYGWSLGGYGEGLGRPGAAR
ncbi:hypothetical protein QF043_003548 [Pseudomonas sp. W3I7]|uniref:hypothetical protein n=1 Tax=Pseudomonas sp. W3I7 TaxID=3042292 RepID=UPI0027934781|nr:hypothetical protein [Pseudomonas sp. W3I7]MDQ0704756.1 hypothetical protein [Pseudomonas sp. W3I7]